MEARAKATFERIAPHKVQIVLDLIRNKPADEAMAILKYTPKAACEPLQKLLKSAMANAEPPMPEPPSPPVAATTPPEITTGVAW